MKDLVQTLREHDIEINLVDILEDMSQVNSSQVDYNFGNIQITVHYNKIIILEKNSNDEWFTEKLVLEVK